MVIVGVDAHKRTHTLVAADEVGRKVGETTVEATPDGHLEALEWAGRWPKDGRFALEDCRHVTRRLEADLLRAGEAVVRVPTRLMAGERRGGRERGKSDPIDALAVARASPSRARPAGRPARRARPASYACSSITGRIWSMSEPASRAGCAGISTSCSLVWRLLPRACAVVTSSTSWRRRLRTVDGTVADDRS